MQKFTPDDLIAAGYKKFPPPQSDHYVALYQKWKWEDGARSYCMSIEEWNWSEFRARIPETTPTVTFSGKLHCKTDSGGYLHATIDEETIQQIETRAFAIWKAVGSVPYGD